MRVWSGISRRAFVASAVAPALVRAQSGRPSIEWGVQSGDPKAGACMVWSRTDRPARLVVEWSRNRDFRSVTRVDGPAALPTTGFTARVELEGLPPGADLFYRAQFISLSDGRTASEPTTGRLRTAPADTRDVRFLWSGDTVGQGFGINPDWGGMRCYETMRTRAADFFIHSGDTIYSDGPLQSELKLPDGSVWRNVVTEAKSRVAQTLDDYRGAYLYNLMDENVRRFNAETPQIWQWDDHEVRNNWSPGADLSGDDRYREKSIFALQAWGSQAFHEFAPMRPSASHAERVYRCIPYGPLLDVFVVDLRSYRGPNTYNRQEAEGAVTRLLGSEQFAWLEAGLKASTARWKVVACDMPIGLLVGDGEDAQKRPKFEAVANGDGPPLGRELEFMRLFRSLKQSRVRNVVWVTADVHYTAAHYYDPARAQFTDFDPFWEFVSGPVHAGTFGPNRLDNTFGPEVAFQKAPPPGSGLAPPSAGLQFFGEVAIEGRTGEMTVTLRDLSGAALYEKRLNPAG